MPTMHLTAGAVGSLFGLLVVGIEDRCDIADDGSPALRVYLHARYRGIYVLLNDEAADAMRAAWSATRHCHLYVRFDPDDVPRWQTPEGQPRAELVEVT